MTWVFMFKRAGNEVSSAKGLRTIDKGFRAPQLLLSDNGSHFRGPEMDTVCTEFGVKREMPAAHTAHANGLVENENKFLMFILGKLCADEMPGVSIPIGNSWPEFFSKAISMLNEWICH